MGASSFHCSGQNLAAIRTCFFHTQSARTPWAQCSNIPKVCPPLTISNVHLDPSTLISPGLLQELPSWSFCFSLYLLTMYFKLPEDSFFFVQVFVLQSLSHVQLFVTRWTSAHQASLSFTISQSLLKLMSIESVMPSNHLILCRPLVLLPSIFPSNRVFSEGQFFASGGQSIRAAASASFLS